MTNHGIAQPGRITLATVAAIAGGCALLVGCATPGSVSARATDSPPPATTAAALSSAIAAAVRPSAPVSSPAAPVITAPVAAAPVADPAAVTVVPPTRGVPHFATPEAAMRYLAAAYNSGDETAIRHVTTPDSRTQFEAERQWVQTFRFRECTANGAPAWDYNCVLDITANVPGVSPNIDATTGLVVMDEVALLVAPAARTGYYVEANEGCGG